ncbi:hypothetical protein F8178_02010 [Haloechinothrix sp. LS1_15]|nr:hypothetical protein [Haloechinothrix sp. LS1_15]
MPGTGQAPSQSSGQGSAAGRGDGVARGGPAAAAHQAGAGRPGGAAGAAGAPARGSGKDDEKERGTAEILKNEQLFETAHDGEIERDPETGRPILPRVIGGDSPGSDAGR